MSYKCQVHTIGFGADGAFEHGGPLYQWGEIFDLNLKPETFERASGLLAEYTNITEDPGTAHLIPGAFTPDENHPRYGLPDDYFWLQRGERWAMVKAPVGLGSYIFKETKLIV